MSHGSIAKRTDIHLAQGYDCPPVQDGSSLRCDTKVTLNVANLIHLGQYGHTVADVNPLIASGFCDSVQEMRFQGLRS